MPLTTEEIAQIMQDAISEVPQKIDTPEAREFLQEFLVDLAFAKKHGLVIDIPYEIRTPW